MLEKMSGDEHCKKHWKAAEYPKCLTFPYVPDPVVSLPGIRHPGIFSLRTYLAPSDHLFGKGFPETGSVFLSFVKGIQFLNTKMETLPKGALSCSSLHPQGLQLCLTHWRSPPNIGWLNEWGADPKDICCTLIYIVDKLKKGKSLLNHGTSMQHNIILWKRF